MAGCILSIRFLNIQYPFPVWHLNEDLFLDACTLDQTRQIRYKKGRSGCGTVGRAVTFTTTGSAVRIQSLAIFYHKHASC